MRVNFLKCCPGRISRGSVIDAKRTIRRWTYICLFWRIELLSCDHPKWKPAPRHALVRFFFLLYSSELRKRPVWQNSWQNKNGSHLPTPPSAHFLGLSTETVYVSFPSLSENKGKTHSNCPLRLVLGTGRKMASVGSGPPSKKNLNPQKCCLSTCYSPIQTRNEWEKEPLLFFLTFFPAARNFFLAGVCTCKVP